MQHRSNFLLSILLLICLLIAPAGNVSAQTPAAIAELQPANGVNPDVQAAAAPNLIQDPSLQSSYRSTLYWNQSSTNADWTVCSTSNVDCVAAGVTGARTGTRWGMFGILDMDDPETINPEVATLSQVVTFPGCGASLSFYLWIGQAPAGSNASDVFNVKIDGNTIFSANATQQSLYATYMPVTLDVSAYANGAAHTLQFHSVTTDQSVVFNLDDISLTRTCSRIAGNAGVAGAAMNYTGGSTTSDGSGNYSISVPYDWSGTVTPSKPSYVFAPASRTYANVVTDMLGQNYTATLYYSISGNAGVAGATITYSGGSTTADGSGNYSFTVPSGWSGAVIPSKSGYRFSPANRTYSNLSANQTAQDFTAVPLYTISGNVGVANVTLSYMDEIAKTVTSAPNGDYSFQIPESWDGTVTPSHPCYTFNPADRTYSNVAADQTAQNYTPVVIPGAGCVSIDVRVAGVDEGSFAIENQGSMTQTGFSGLSNGPVEITSTVPILGGERIVYKVNGVNTSFTEMLGLPDGQLDTVYWLPWYNNATADLDTQLRFANVNTSGDATVRVYIGGVEMTGSPFTLAAGESTRKSFAGISNGPVKIESDIPIVAAERIVYKVNNVGTSFTEMMALPNTQLDTVYWLPWYNNLELDTQLRFANVNSVGDATVRVYIGGVEMTGSPFTLTPGESTRKSFPGVSGGPVKIESDIPIVAAERIVYKVNNVGTSFTEMMALPNAQLDTIYWFPRYNNVEMDTQLRFANINTSGNATVHIYVNGVEMTGSPFTLTPGESTRKSFPGVNDGLVKIESDIPIVAAERVVFKVNNIGTSFTEMMGLPNGQLDTTYWLPWYNNLELNTMLRFGIP